MDPEPMPGSDRAATGPARVGRRRLGGREDGVAAVGTRWSWLSALGGGPVRLTAENASVEMSVRWLGGMIVRGVFREVRGVIHVPRHDDESAAVTVEVAADSVRTGITLRDRHLRGPLFLDAGHHPTVTFRGGDVMRLPTHVAIPGSLTIRGVTRTEELRCPLDGFEAGSSLRGAVTLSRRAYSVGVPTGLRKLDPLFVVIGDEVRISVTVRL
jgi:polyisoprenoid-binding protein YceI